MADTTALKNRIRAAIKANGNQEITGPILQNALLDTIDELDLNPELENEVQQRRNGDNTLQQNINQERQRAETSEQNLQESIGSIKEETLEENREMVNSILENYAPVEITGDVNNAADEEDLTSVSVEGTDVLKFKDKVYNPLVYSGLGRKILRKNIVNGINTLTQSMINQPNTIYVIQYDFTLGEDITVPANCVLEFEGGSISSNGNGNDTITGSNTKIAANKVIIFKDITIEGSWNVITIYDSWFSNSIREQAIINSIALTSEYINNTVYIDNDYDITVKDIRTERYDSDFPGIPRTFIILKSNTVLYINGVWREANTERASSNIIEIINVSNVTVKGKGHIIGDLDVHHGSGHPTDEWNCGIMIFGSKNVCIDGIAISKLVGDCITIDGGNSEDVISSNITIKNCVLHDSKRQGISVNGVEIVEISDCFIYNITDGAPSSAIDCEADHNRICRNIIISNIIIQNCITAIQCIAASNVDISDVHVKLSDNTAQIGNVFNLLRSNNINFKNINIEGTRTSYVLPALDMLKFSIIYIYNVNNLIVNNLCSDIVSAENGPKKFRVENSKSVVFENCIIQLYDGQFIDVTDSYLNVTNSIIKSTDAEAQGLDTPMFSTSGTDGEVYINGCRLEPDNRNTLVSLASYNIRMSNCCIDGVANGYGFVYFVRGFLEFINNIVNLAAKPGNIKGYITYSGGTSQEATISNNTFKSATVDNVKLTADYIMFNFGNNPITVYTSGNCYNNNVFQYDSVSDRITVEKKTGF